MKNILKKSEREFAYEEGDNRFMYTLYTYIHYTHTCIYKSFISTGG